MTRGHRQSYFAVVLLLAACGGSTPPAEAPSEPAQTNEVTPPPPPAESAEKPAAESAPPKKEEVPEPAFTPDMSVDQAIKVIPPEAERVNIDQETMSKPLRDGEVFDKCKAGASHFKVKIAVWRGKAVAMDLTTTPKNPKLAECVRGVINELTWTPKVPSLNSVEYAM